MFTTFKQYSKKQFIINWIVILLVLVTGAAAFTGYNSIDGSFDLFAGFGVVGEMFGGIASLGALAGVIVALAIIVLGLVYIAKKDYSQNNGLLIVHIILGLAVVIGAAYVGIKWIVLPADGWAALGIALAVLLFTGIATAIVTHRNTETVFTASTSGPATKPASTK